MEKPANTDYPIHDLIRRRWSPRAFAARPVEAEKVASLFEAARWAPSSFNGQPWHYIVAAKDDEAAFARLLNCLRSQEYPMGAACAGADHCGSTAIHVAGARAQPPRFSRRGSGQ